MSIDITKMLSRLLPVDDFYTTVKRFPLSAICSLVIFALLLAGNHNWFKFDDELAGKIIALSACGFFWFGATQLVREARGLSLTAYAFYSAPVLVLLVAKIFIFPHWDLFLMFAIPALLSFIMIAPFFSRDEDDACFWHFNRSVWTGAAVAIVASWVLGGGVCLTLLSIHYLFDVKINEKIYWDIWMFTSLIFCPLHTLSWVPRDFSDRGADFIYPRWIAFIVNWIKAPLVAVYFLILYAYMAKIVIHGQLPHGNVSYMVTGFAGCGIIAYMVAWPLRDNGTPLLRLVIKYFWRSMMLPVLLLFVAIGVRIHEYGVTEQRYMMALAALFFAIVTGLFVVLGDRMKIRAIPAVLACFMVLGSFGPWGAVAVSGKSQMHRLEALLLKNSILQSGRIVKHTGSIDFEDEKSISSIIDYLGSTKRGDMLRPWFEPPYGSWLFSGTHSAIKEMGLDYISSYQTVPGEDGAFNFSAQTWIDVSGYDRLAFSGYSSTGTVDGTMREWPGTTGNPSVKVVYAGEGIIRVEVGAGYGDLLFDFKPYTARFLESAPVSPVIAESENSKLRGRLIIEQAGGKSTEGKLDLSYAGFSLLLDYRDR